AGSRPASYLESSLRYEVAFAPRAPAPDGGAPPAPPAPCTRPAPHAWPSRACRSTSPTCRTGVPILNLPGLDQLHLAVRVRPDGVSYSGYWSAWSAPSSVVTPHDLDPLILSLSLILVLILVLLALFALLTHRRFLKKKLWPVIPSPEHKFEGLFTLYKGNFQLWLGQRNTYPWWSANPGYLEEQPTTLEVLSEGRESKAEGPVPPLPPKAQGLVLPTRPEPPVEPQDDYLVLDEQLMPCSLGEDSLLLPDAQSSAGSESPPAMGQELGPPGATLEPVPEERVSSSSSFEYTVFDPSSQLLAPCGHQRPLKYSYLLVSDSGISTDYSPLGTSTHQPNLYTNLCQDGCQAQPFPASYMVCS
uniref:Erythropoietin receptor n=1 Tax=Chelonoidis abingdonii TaxID=106734 RepID=A0A8C0G8Q8_CHEAB